MKLLFIQTGGTIDKGYPAGDDHHGYGFEIGEPAFVRVLQRINPDFEYEVKVVSQKDSLDITDEDRKLLLASIKESNEDRIIVTHGTDTMIQTADMLGEISDKTVVITGAMNPELFKDSDAEFNIGFAIAAASSLPRGVYIAMSGRIYKQGMVIFNTVRNRFEAKG